MENQNNEADLVNDLSEVLNELKEIEERSGGCDLWRTAAWNGHGGDFVCFERCDGVTIQEAARKAFDYSEGKRDAAWYIFSERRVWSDPENKKCNEGWLKDYLGPNKQDNACDPSVNGCMYD